MYENLVRACGLTQNESLVYLALLKLGKAKSSKIVKEASISSGKIYETLEKLTSKGLVKLIVDNGVKNFMANDPEMLIEYLREKEKELHKKEEELEKILPQLKELKNSSLALEDVSLVKGFRGIKPLVYNALENCEGVKIMGVTSKKGIKFNNFWMPWHKERVKLRKKAQVIFSDKSTEYWKFHKNLKYTEVREVFSFTPSAVMIMGEELFLFSYGKEFSCIHIVSKSLSESFSQFFNGLWKLAGNKNLKQP